jgi:hypothetical protein
MPIAHNDVQVRSSLGDWPKGGRERSGMVIDVRAPQDDLLCRDCHVLLQYFERGTAAQLC